MSDTLHNNCRHSTLLCTYSIKQGSHKSNNVIQIIHNLWSIYSLRYNKWRQQALVCWAINHYIFLGIVFTNKDIQSHSKMHVHWLSWSIDFQSPLRALKDAGKEYDIFKAVVDAGINDSLDSDVHRCLPIWRLCKCLEDIDPRTIGLSHEAQWALWINYPATWGWYLVCLGLIVWKQSLCNILTNNHQLHHHGSFIIKFISHTKYLSHYHLPQSNILTIICSLLI